MKKHTIVLTTLIIVLFFSAFDARKPRILIIGDSIAAGYTPYVKAHFKDQAIVERIPGNAQHTGTGIEKIVEWVGDKEWDIIQFNWGLWDLCYRHPDSKIYGNRDKINGNITFELSDYEANLDSVVTILKGISNAKLVFVTTTYVPENEAGRFMADAIRYNEAAIRVMKKHSVNINDIYEASIPIHKEYGVGNDDVHFTEKGNEKLSMLIIDFLKNELKTL